MPTPAPVGARTVLLFGGTVDSLAGFTAPKMSNQVEIEWSRRSSDADLRHLRWLTDRLSDHLLNAGVITTGPRGYRRGDGTAMIPAALLGP